MLGDQPETEKDCMGGDKGGTRKERDSLGEIEVPAHRYWGAGTQRSLKHFSIGDDLVPLEVVYALTLVKKAAAMANRQLGGLPEKYRRIDRQGGGDEILAGRLDDNFPLRVYMTGSAPRPTDVDEVIANRANELAGEGSGARSRCTPTTRQSPGSHQRRLPHGHAYRRVHDPRGAPDAQVERLRQALDDKAGKWAGG